MRPGFPEVDADPTGKPPGMRYVLFVVPSLVFLLMMTFVVGSKGHNVAAPLTGFVVAMIIAAGILYGELWLFARQYQRRRNRLRQGAPPDTVLATPARLTSGVAARAGGKQVISGDVLYMRRDDVLFVPAQGGQSVQVPWSAVRRVRVKHTRQPILGARLDLDLFNGQTLTWTVNFGHRALIDTLGALQAGT